MIERIIQSTREDAENPQNPLLKAEAFSYLEINPEYYSVTDYIGDMEDGGIYEPFNQVERPQHERKHCMIQCDGSSLRITIYMSMENIRTSKFSRTRIVDIQLTGEALKGEGWTDYGLRGAGKPLPIFTYMSGLLPNGWQHPLLQQGLLVFRIGPTVDLFMALGNEITKNTSEIGSEIPIVTGEIGRALVVDLVDNTTHVWAIKNKMTEKIRTKMFASNFTHVPCFAVFTARPSNIGVSFYNERSGQTIAEWGQLIGFNTRPHRVFEGRTETWLEGRNGTLACEVFRDNFDWRHKDEYAYAEIHFPRRIPLNALLSDVPAICGAGIVLGQGSPAQGSYRRVYTTDQYGGKHPLMKHGQNEVGSTDFEKIYEPPIGVDVTKISYTELFKRNDDMTPQEIDEVKKWFANYVQTLARKGETLSEEALEIAKAIGVYTGN